MIGRILDRYVTREFLRLFVLFSLAAPLLFVIGDWTDNLDRYTSRDIALGAVALSYVYQLPLFILWSFPIAALVATVFTVSNMTRHSELAAAKAGGVSFWRTIAVMPVLGIVLTAVGIGLSELVPITFEKRAVLLGEKDQVPGVRGNFVYRAKSGAVFSVRQLDVQGGRMRNVVIEQEGDREHRPDIHIVANDAVWDTAEGWTLNEGFYRVFPPDAEQRAFSFTALRLPAFTETPEELLVEPPEPEEMRYAELGRFIDMLERSGGRPLDLKVEHAQKIAIPVATLVIILFAAPLANSHARSGPAHGIGVSLGVTILYMMLLRVATAFGATGSLPPFVAAWLPNTVFVLAAGVLMARVRT
ncbi:MAG: LptF/LptG family permease [Longimicrobiales bacterium]